MGVNEVHFSSMLVDARYPRATKQNKKTHFPLIFSAHFCALQKKTVSGRAAPQRISYTRWHDEFSCTSARRRVKKETKRKKNIMYITTHESSACLRWNEKERCALDNAYRASVYNPSRTLSSRLHPSLCASFTPPPPSRKMRYNCLLLFLSRLYLLVVCATKRFLSAALFYLPTRSDSWVRYAYTQKGCAHQPWEKRVKSVGGNVCIKLKDRYCEPIMCIMFFLLSFSGGKRETDYYCKVNGIFFLKFLI